MLFLCTGNSCRSQMAEGWARHLRGDVMEPASAGTRPKAVNRRAAAVMAEAGVDISGARPRSVDEMTALPFDLVVTVCGSAVESCPVFPGDVRTIHHSFDDPPVLAERAGSDDEAMAVYRRVRDESRAFIEQLQVDG